MAGKAARLKKLKEQLAKCSVKLNQVVAKHKLFDLDSATTPEALNDLAVTCGLDDHDVHQLNRVLVVVADDVGCFASFPLPC